MELLQSIYLTHKYSKMILVIALIIFESVCHFIYYIIVEVNNHHIKIKLF